MARNRLRIAKSWRKVGDDNFGLLNNYTECQLENKSIQLSPMIIYLLVISDGSSYPTIKGIGYEVCMCISLFDFLW